MKKISIFLLTLLSVLCLVACGEPTPEPAPAPEKDYTYHVVGGYYDDWNNYTEENKMTEITREELATLNADMASKLGNREVSAIMKFEGRVFNVGPAWTANANVDGEVVVLNGGYTIKVVRALYDAEDDVTAAETWIPDPHKAAVTNLTPDTLYMPKWVETPAEGEEGLGTWADNPVVIGGAGEYTVICVEFAGANSAEAPKWAFGLIKTKELEEPKTLEELIVEEYAALKDGSLDSKDATEFEVTAEIVAADCKYSEEHKNYNVKLIVKLGETLIGIYNGQVWDDEKGKGVYPTDVTGLEVGKNVTFKGKIAAGYDLTVGDFHADIEFSYPVISWAKTGAGTGLYLRGLLEGWPAADEYELVYNEAGNPEITLELEAGAEFKVADPDWTAATTFGYNENLSEAFADKGGNILVSTAGTYTISIVDGTLVIEAGRTGLYVKGGMNGWGAVAEYELRYNADGNPEITVELEAGAEFKVADPDWNVEYAWNAELPAGLTGSVDANGKGSNITVSTAGTYTFTVVEGVLVAVVAE